MPHLPAPSHWAGGVYLSAAQASMAHVVLGGAKRHAPAPSHCPSRPQMSLPGSQSSCGSVPDWTPSHAPSGLPVTAFEHDLQTPSHASEQQTPSRQELLAQSRSALHLSPPASPMPPPSAVASPAAPLLPPAVALPALLEVAPVVAVPPLPSVTCSVRSSKEQPANKASTTQKSHSKSGRFFIRIGLSPARWPRVDPHRNRSSSRSPPVTREQRAGSSAAPRR